MSEIVEVTFPRLSREATAPTEPYVRNPDAATVEQRMLRYRERNPHIPVVESLDRKILDAIAAGGMLNMSHWHTCETTHCRAGWAAHGPHQAGVMIYRASTGRVPHFFATDKAALADITERAQSAA
jgi:hypothetical protein